MNDMEQLAVEWLVEQLDLNVFESDEEVADVIDKAKAMEKEQIIKANRDGVDMVVDKKDFILGEQYYNETFK